MVPIKIQCGCGQKYTFDIEPVDGHMPWAVACPVCGMDGTSAANLAITQTLSVLSAAPVPAQPAMRLAAAQPASFPPAAPPVASAGTTHVRLASHTTTQRTAGRLPGQIAPDQALIEARAKISWGDEPVEVVKYLMIQGFTREEAREHVREMFRERVETIRKNGFGKIIKGSALICVPIISLLIFMAMGFILLKVLAVMIMVGLYGLWLVIKGIIMVVSPKSEGGDVAEQ